MSDPIGDGMQAFADAVVVVGRFVGDGLTLILGGGTMLLFVILTSPIWLTGLAIRKLQLASAGAAQENEISALTVNARMSVVRRIRQMLPEPEQS